MYLVVGHALMAMGAFLLYKAFGWQAAVGFFCLIEGAALFAVGLISSEKPEPKPWHAGLSQ